MSNEFTADDLDIAYHRAAADAVQTKVDAEKKARKFKIASDIRRLSRELSALLQEYEKVTRRDVPGMVLQRFERDLAGLIEIMDRIIDHGTRHHWSAHRLLRYPYDDFRSKRDQLQDYRVTFNASTDPELADHLKSVAMEESVPWKSIH